MSSEFEIRKRMPVSFLPQTRTHYVSFQNSSFEIMTLILILCRHPSLFFVDFSSLPTASSVGRNNLPTMDHYHQVPAHAKKSYGDKFFQCARFRSNHKIHSTFQGKIDHMV